jgi:hypothetical protein
MIRHDNLAFRELASGCPDEFAKESPKMWPNPFFVKINKQRFTAAKSCPKVRATYLCKFQETAQNKHLPNWRKFVPSGQPAKRGPPHFR